ncbi:MAG: hypothetical protein DRP00_05560 [Candidatus Aenigmatarchaeota archaeon]|nr:MAG: hypothetical protein DRP00_05560 [Candidatus Aenigmarchaeota archaeon]
MFIILRSFIDYKDFTTLFSHHNFNHEIIYSKVTFSKNTIYILPLVNQTIFFIPKNHPIIQNKTIHQPFWNRVFKITKEVINDE